VQSKLNQVGQNVSKLRRRRGWTLEEFAAKLELVGCHITPEVLADIETCRCAVTDAQIALFSEVLRVQIKDLYIRQPKK
jgi:transcriptional regulator with XRE-family HTH domain